MFIVYLLALGVGLVLGVLGGGGAILTVPVLAYAAHVPAKQAIAMSLAVVGTTAAAGMLQHARSGNVRWRQGLIFATAGMTGSYMGARLAAFVPGPVLLMGFGGLMLVSAFFMARPVRKEETRELSHLWLLPIGLGVGSITGMVGAGGGFAIVPALTLLVGVPMRQAIGTSLLVIMLQSFAGLAGYLGHESIDWRLAAAVAAVAVVGSVVGGRMANRIPRQHLRAAFAGLMVVMAFYIGFREFDHLTASSATTVQHSAVAVPGTPIKE